ncbi:hypothetical protein MTP99_008218 [Tenebrio molitor]|jgi:hypothetical protein|nr:hypothetical protein MTP99_008218 [Tenebrio molitor]
MGSPRGSGAGHGMHDYTGKGSRGDPGNGPGPETRAERQFRSKFIARGRSRPLMNSKRTLLQRQAAATEHAATPPGAARSRAAGTPSNT